MDFVDKNHIKNLDLISLELAEQLPLPKAHLKMVIIIPAKDESEGILKTLNAIARQKDGNKKLLDSSSFELLILCHNCCDTTFDKCQQFSLENPSLQIHILELNSRTANTVGAARRILMNIAHDRLKETGWIVSTDADTIPRSNWLYQIDTYSHQNISLVCGLIKSSFKNLSPQTRTYLKAKNEYLSLKAKLEDHLLPDENDPWPRHNFHWGPNLAIKKEVYQAVGGIHPLHFLEDVDLYHRVLSHGYGVKHCMKTEVTTSSRVDSRCNEGFGAELRVWTEIEGVPYHVEGLNKLLTRLEIYNLIKFYCEAPSTEILEKISELSMFSLNDIEGWYHMHKRFEALKIKMEIELNRSTVWHQQYSNTPVLQACTELRDYLKNIYD